MVSFILNFNLNPYFIIGLIEAEGSFSIVKYKYKKAKYDINVGLRFKIVMLANELLSVEKKPFFFVGTWYIFLGKDGYISFEVNNLNYLNKI